MKLKLSALLAVAGLDTGCTAIPVLGPGPGAGAAVGSGAAAGTAGSSAGAGAAAGESARTTGVDSGAGAELPPERVLPGPSVALLDLSRDQRAAGDLGGAAATIERALTISPDEAVLWVELAEIRMDQGDTALAEEMARKALSLTNESTATAARARRLLRR
jgi:tetratricopeptide (TPR) repeat protein